jgi:hypothetical protein
MSSLDKIHKEARRQETLTAKTHGGRATPGSGSGGFDKNDVTNDEWSLEVKTTSQKGYRLTLETWLTTEKQALHQGKTPAMVIAFAGPDRRTRRLVLMDEGDFIEKVTRYGASPETISSELGEG